MGWTPASLVWVAAPAAKVAMCLAMPLSMGSTMPAGDGSTLDVTQGGGALVAGAQS